MGRVTVSHQLGAGRLLVTRLAISAKSSWCSTIVNCTSRGWGRTGTKKAPGMFKTGASFCAQPVPTWRAGWRESVSRYAAQQKGPAGGAGP
jgi:hypothetical protein